MFANPSDMRFFGSPREGHSDRQHHQVSPEVFANLIEIIHQGWTQIAIGYFRQSPRSVSQREDVPTYVPVWQFNRGTV